MFGGDVHLRAYADLQRAGLSPNLGRCGLDQWTRDLAGIEFDLVAVATRAEASAQISKSGPGTSPSRTTEKSLGKMCCAIFLIWT